MHLPEFTLLAIATVAAIAAGFGVGMLALGRPRFGVVRVLFWISALTFWSLGIVWSATSAQTLSIQMAVAAVIGAIAAAGLTWGLWEVRNQEGMNQGHDIKSIERTIYGDSIAVRVTAPERKFTNRSIRELRALFEGRTILQGDRLIEPHKGLWINTEGTVIMILPGPTAVINNANDTIECHFGQEWGTDLARYNNGDLMKVRGKISNSQNGQQIYLNECEII
jgi:hypothetical protein